MNRESTNSFFEQDQHPVTGLPGPLPPGERVLWQGRPLWRDLAVHALHLRKLAIYFAIVVAWRAWSLAGAPAAEVATGLAWAVGLSLVALALVAGGAWLIARATYYTITDRRVVLRSGVALPISANLPLAHVVSADLAERADGQGDIALTLDEDNRPSRIVLWPYVRPWHFSRVQPMLRSLPDVRAVARVLAGALRQEVPEDAEGRVDPVALSPDSRRSAA